jgi:DNA-binding NtrC family response regulator
MQDKIIFVDDERGILEALKWLFMDEPYQIESFDSASEALNLAERAEPAVMVSDQRMPEMSGTEFLEQVRDRWPDTIRIIMTADPDETVRQALSHEEIHGVIVKPWDQSEFKHLLRNAVDKYHDSCTV